MLDPFVASHHHVVADSFVFKRKLEDAELALPESAKMCCIDLKDFFLSGDAGELSNDVSSVVPSSLTSLFRETAFMVLNNQYVICSGLPNWYKCISGSGICLNHSAAVANTAFLVVVESHFIFDLAAHGILLWLRYHDDIFDIFLSRQHLLDFCAYFHTILGYFKAKARQISSTEVTFLDLTVQCVGGRLPSYPSLSKVPKPLRVHSSHAPRVHKGWPRAVIQRACNLGDISASAQLLSNHVDANTHPATLQLMRDDIAVLHDHAPTALARLPGQTPRVAAIFRHHPAILRALQFALKRVPLPPSIGMTILPSWTNALPCVGGILTKHNDTLGSGSLRDTEEGVSLLSLSLFPMGLLH